MNMKRYARILCATTLLCGLSVAAKAELRDDVAVTVPFEFVVGGKTLSAGTYKIASLSLSKSSLLQLTSRDTGASVFILPFEGESVNVDMPQLSFQQVGERHFLSTVQTGQNIYNIRVSHLAAIEAAAGSRNNLPVSGGELIR